MPSLNPEKALHKTLTFIGPGDALRARIGTVPTLPFQGSGRRSVNDAISLQIKKEPLFLDHIGPTPQAMHPSPNLKNREHLEWRH